jgi:hypothetical protein
VYLPVLLGFYGGGSSPPQSAGHAFVFSMRGLTSVVPGLSMAAIASYDPSRSPLGVERSGGQPYGLAFCFTTVATLAC